MVIRIAVASAWLLCLSALTPGAVRAGPAENLQKAGDFTVRPYTLTSPGGRSVEAELWRLAVPEDRHKETSRLIEIAFVRLKSTAKQPGPPLVYLAGGPGSSGIGAVRGPALPLFLDLRDAGDVVLLDQRGTGISRPVLESMLTWDAPLDKPGDPALLLRVFKDRLRAAAGPFTNEGISLSAYNPAEAADDVEAVRVALGARKLNLWGVSYGTYLALATVRRHEQSIHRAILTGVVGPDQANLRRPASVQEQLEQVHRLFKEDENASKAVPDLLGSLQALLDRLEKEPVAVELTDPHTKKTVQVVVGKWDLQFFLANRIGRTYSLKGLPGFCAPLFRGDLRPLASEALAFRRGTVGSLMGWQMLGSSGTSSERVRLVEREAPGTLLGDAVNFPFPAVAAALTIQDFGPVFRARLRSGVPLLFISGTLDLDLANVSEIQDSFADHAHLIVDGASHGYDLFYFAPGLKDRMLEFLSGRPLSALRINLLPFRFDPVGKSSTGGGQVGGGEKEGAFDYYQVGQTGRGLCRVLTLDLGAGVTMELVRIPAGTFQMGSPLVEKERRVDEEQHRVEITRDFYLGKYEVTRGQFRAFVKDTGYRTEPETDGQGGWGYDEDTGKIEGRKPKYTWKSTGFAQTDEHPVVNVTWNDANAFCRWLAQRTKKSVRLPTEAEWEYACRAGSATRFYSGEDAETLAKVGNVADPTAKKKFPDWQSTIATEDGYVFTAPVGQFRANRFGLYDMHGNVWEWCQDWLGPYGDLGAKDPVRDNQGKGVRVMRGGSWGKRIPQICSSALRFSGAPPSRDLDVGFRVSIRLD